MAPKPAILIFNTLLLIYIFFVTDFCKRVFSFKNFYLLFELGIPLVTLTINTNLTTFFSVNP